MKKPPPPQSLAAIGLLPILLVNFIGTLGYSIILPFLIILVLKFGGNELTYGIMGATYSLFQFIGAPLLGNWSDRYGRKKILLLSQGGTFLAWILFVIALQIPVSGVNTLHLGGIGSFAISLPLIVLFAARALDGITGGNVSVANAYLADITTEKERKANFGKMAASANLGFILGPALAGVLGETPLEELLPVLVALVVSLIAIFVIASRLPESNPCVLSKPLGNSIKKVMGQEHKECYNLKGAQKLGLSGILRLNHVAFILLLYFAIFLAFNFFYVAFPVHAVQNLGWSLFRLGLFFSLLGLCMVLVQGPLLNRLSDRFSDSTLAIAGSLFLGIGFAFFVQPNNPAILTALLLFALGNGIMWPSFLSILSKAAGNTYQGAVQGYAGSAGSLASIIGLITGSLLYAQLQEITFLIPAALVGIIFLLSFRLRSIEKESK